MTDPASQQTSLDPLDPLLAALERAMSASKALSEAEESARKRALAGGEGQLEAAADWSREQRRRDKANEALARAAAKCVKGGLAIQALEIVRGQPGEASAAALAARRSAWGGWAPAAAKRLGAEPAIAKALAQPWPDPTGFGFEDVERASETAGPLLAALAIAAGEGRLEANEACAAAQGVGQVFGAVKSLSPVWFSLGRASGKSLAEANWTPERQAEAFVSQWPSACWAGMAAHVGEDALMWAIDGMALWSAANDASLDNPANVSNAGCAAIFIGCLSIARGLERAAPAAWSMAPKTIAQTWSAGGGASVARLVGASWMELSSWSAPWAREAAKACGVDGMGRDELARVLVESPERLAHWGRAVIARFESAAIVGALKTDVAPDAAIPGALSSARRI
jgi:hypothetical protein